MKIISKGIVPGDRKYRFTCTKCNSVFEAKQSEGEYRSDWGDGDYIQFTCLVCYAAINVAVESHYGASYNRHGDII